MRRFSKNLMILVCLLMSIGSAGYADTSAPEPVTDAGGDLVNNGGGLAEKALLILFENLDAYLQSCLNSFACSVDHHQREMLQKILEGLPHERSNPKLIQFVSERSQPGFFVIDSEIKVAKTGSQPGSVIYVNTDMLYRTDHAGYKLPIGNPEMLAILIHELGHHYGSATHDFLDLLGVRVGMFISMQSYSTPVLPWLKNVSVSVINTSMEPNGFPDMMIFLGDRALNIKEEVKQSGLCLYQLYTGSELQARRPQGTFIYNLHWSLAKQRSSGRSDLIMTAVVNHLCQYSSSFKPEVQTHELIIRFKVEPLPGGGYNAKRIMIEQRNGKPYRPR